MYTNTQEFTIGPECPWYEAQQSYGPPNVNWCEPTQCAIINEPANTWSNLGFLLVGILIFNKITLGTERLFKDFGIAIFLMGLFSGIYHATNNFYTQFYDFLGMYVMTSFVMAVFIRRIQGEKISHYYAYFWMLLFFNTLIFWAFHMNNIPIQFTVIINALSLAGLEIIARIKERKSPSLKYFWISLLCLGVAQVFSLADLKRYWCEPDNLFLHGHAIWHLIGAIGMWFLGLHLRECLSSQKT